MKKEKAKPYIFAFSDENLVLAKKIIAKYPRGRQASAVIPLLDLAQRQNGGWLPQEAMDVVAKMLDMPPVKVYEVATFYTMFNLNPVGENVVRVCTTTPCALRGGDGILHACRERLGIKVGETTKDGKFTLHEVECLGACVGAPVAQINDDVHDNLTSETIGKILDDLALSKKPAASGATKNGKAKEKRDA